jgi:hypothetical protein
MREHLTGALKRAERSEPSSRLERLRQQRVRDKVKERGSLIKASLEGSPKSAAGYSPPVNPTTTTWRERCVGHLDGAVMVCVINEVNDRPVGNPKSKVR